MSVEKEFHFRRVGRPYREGEVFYRIVVITRSEGYAPAIRATGVEVFTRKEKEALEALSYKVNEERRKRGIL